MALFQKSRPTEVFTPKPLVEPVRSKKALVFVLLFILLASVSAYFFWSGYSTADRKLADRASIRPADIKPEGPRKTREVNRKTEPLTMSKQIQPDLSPKTDSEIALESTPPNERGQTDSIPEATPETRGMEQVVVSQTKAEESTAEPPYEPREQAIESTNLPDSDDTLDTSASPELTLRANIRERTWLRIYVDDKDPKEYIFQPGERYRWKAQKGYEILIGNAGSIDFELNGEAVEYVGTPGEVLRLRLPKGYSRRRLQD